MIKCVKRREDMSAVGYLQLLRQEDGDIIVAVFADEHNSGCITKFADVEFCTTGIGGGKSQRVWNALEELMEAMEADNIEHPSGRTPER